MDSREFASAYQLVPPARTGEEPQVAQMMQTARGWSDRFGRMLHTYLQAPGEPVTDVEDPIMTEYGAWAGRQIPALERAAWTHNTPDSLRAVNELNFHRLNASMIALWTPVLDGRWPEDDEQIRNNLIANAQDLVALRGLQYYYTREQNSGPKGDYVYFAEANQERRGVFEGLLNEFDAGIVLLEIVRRHPGLTVVPAPQQFEHSNRARYNVDFVIVSEDGEAIGVQVKSNVTDQAMRRYDPDYAVLVDANVDLGNVLAKRTSPKRSDMRVIGWSGMLCAQRVMTIPRQGPRPKMLREEHVDQRAILLRKVLARQMLENVRPAWQTAVQRVDERVQTKIHSGPTKGAAGHPAAV